MTAIVAEMCAAVSEGGFVILPETADHGGARERLLDRAMGAGRRRKSSEKLRSGRLPSEGLAFAAADPSGQLCGTVRLWDVMAGTDHDGRAVSALLLGPLAVDPRWEGLGLGTALMRRAIGEAAARGHGAILLVGDACYYGRFGFHSEPACMLAMPGPVERERFLALELAVGYLDGASGVLTGCGRRSAERASMATAA